MGRHVWTLLMVAPLIVCCASGIERMSPTREAVPNASGDVVKKVNVSFMPGAQKIANHLTPDQNRLLDTVRLALRARNLLDENDPHATRTVDIVITQIRVRSNLNAQLWGFMAGADKLNGDVTLHDDKGRDLNHFSVYANYAPAVIGEYADVETRMGWLYEKFAELTVQNLEGVAK